MSINKDQALHIKNLIIAQQRAALDMLDDNNSYTEWINTGNTLNTYIDSLVEEE